MNSLDYFASIKARLLVDPAVAALFDRPITVTLINKESRDSEVWIIDGRSREVKPGADVVVRDIACDIQIDEEDFAEVIRGKLNPQVLFGEQRITVTGEQPLEALKFFSLIR